MHSGIFRRMHVNVLKEKDCWGWLWCAWYFIVTLTFYIFYSTTNDKKILTVEGFFQVQYTKLLHRKTGTDTYPSKSVHHDTFSSTTLVRSLRATLRSHTSTGPPLISPGKETTLSNQHPAVISQCAISPFEGTVALLQFSLMWNSCFYHPVLGKEEKSGRWRMRFLFNLDPPKWKETACWQACERSTAGSTGELQRPV